MTMKEIISAIEIKHKADGITLYPPASNQEVQDFESRIGFELPADFREFYSICNGFECEEDIFRIIPLEEILEYGWEHGNSWFHFAEYMTFCDMWSLRKKADGEFEIFNEGEVEVVLTSSLYEFLQRFLRGNVFDEGGLYDWRDELKLM